MTGQRQATQTALAAGSDATRPHPARVYDWFLGGTSHTEADARAGEAVLAAMPVTRTAALANRDFMTRATRLLASRLGIRQFLDLGSGIPTEPALHRVAQSVAPDARVVYADNDPVVLEHARRLVSGAPEGTVACAYADVTDPDSVLDAPELSDTLDLGRPVALSVNAVLHFVTDDRQPYAILRTLLSALPAGSCLVLTHATADFLDDGALHAAQSVLGIWAESGSPVRPRSASEVARFFDGLRLIGPGIVPPHLWHPDGPLPPELGRTSIPGYAGVARKL
ncbi:SAM-dependent methyltransferase [Streptomyces sp. HNM0574]|uniref:SAM-dependent methyltransferase n=1 Tax=Streptomyces sp. HNM0574 TaxID=2714954 RepID=UPI00146C7F61|nr:SAM-dependent methyltransferase [Streptomyces sp. HNM0574]NLU70624.1 SAM-dependent methyltransferase [Streptomyces sp. HNM0574]